MRSTTYHTGGSTLPRPQCVFSLGLSGAAERVPRSRSRSGGPARSLVVVVGRTPLLKRRDQKVTTDRRQIEAQREHSAAYQVNDSASRRHPPPIIQKPCLRRPGGGVHHPVEKRSVTYTDIMHQAELVERSAGGDGGSVCTVQRGTRHVNNIKEEWLSGAAIVSRGASASSSAGS